MEWWTAEQRWKSIEEVVEEVEERRVLRYMMMSAQSGAVGRRGMIWREHTPAVVLVEKQRRVYAESRESRREIQRRSSQESRSYAGYLRAVAHLPERSPQDCREHAGMRQTLAVEAQQNPGQRLQTVVEHRSADCRLLVAEQADYMDDIVELEEQHRSRCYCFVVVGLAVDLT